MQPRIVHNRQQTATQPGERDENRSSSSRVGAYNSSPFKTVHDTNKNRRRSAARTYALLQAPRTLMSTQRGRRSEDRKYMNVCTHASAGSLRPAKRVRSHSLSQPHETRSHARAVPARTNGECTTDKARSRVAGVLTVCIHSKQ